MTPMQVAEKYVELGRRNGKTTAMISALPNEKCAILVASNDNVDTLKTRITEQRPDYDLENVTFLLYRPNSGWRDRLLLRDMHVYIDNDVLDELCVLQVKAINDVYGKTSAKE